jgi:hypothetical protein
LSGENGILVCFLTHAIDVFTSKLIDQINKHLGSKTEFQNKENEDEMKETSGLNQKGSGNDYRVFEN